MAKRMWAGVAVAVVLAGAGCGKSETAATTDVSTGPTPELLTQAATKTAGAGTGRVDGTMHAEVHFEMFDEAITTAIDADVAGEYDLPNKTSHLRGTLTAFEEEPASKEPAAVGDTFESIVIGDDSYVQETKGGEAERYDGKAWKHTGKRDEKADPLTPVARLAGLEEDGQVVDPQVLLEQLQHAGTPTDAGREAVGGVDTRHVRVTIPVAGLYDGRADESLGVPAGCVQPAIGDLAVTADVFIDQEGYVRRIVTEGDLGRVFDAVLLCTFGTGGGSTVTTSATSSSTYRFRTSLDYLDPGKPVTITAPDPADVADG